VKILDILNRSTVTQQVFAQIVGISEARVSQLASEGAIARGATAAAWLASYCERLREQAAGRVSADGDYDLVRERAGLARAQRERVELQNAVTRGEFAPIELLGDALSKAVEVMVSELEQIDGLLAQTCPDLPEAPRQAVLSCVATARNKIATRGAGLVMAAICPEDDIDAEEEGATE
jgi:phage terminase Nu1 subunit (DNA packaging protein)